MLHRTIAMKPLRLYTSYAPSDVDDIFSRELDIDPEIAIGSFLDRISAHPGMENMRAAIRDDLLEMREAGRLGGQLDAPGRSVEFIEAWNAFLAGDSSEAVMAIAGGPVETLVENEAVRLFISGKTRRGPVLPHHFDASPDLATAERRLLGVEASLNDHLARGSFGPKFFGMETAHDGSGLMRVKLDGFRPVLERAMKRENVRTWHPVEVVELERDAAPALA